MKFISFIFLYIRYCWLVSIKVKSIKDPEKVKALYAKADKIEEKLYQIVQ